MRGWKEVMETGSDVLDHLRNPTLSTNVFKCHFKTILFVLSINTMLERIRIFCASALYKLIID